MRALPALTVADDTPTSATGAVLVKQRSSRRVAMRPNRRGAGIDTVRQLYLIFLLMVVVIDTIVSIMVKHTLSDRKFMTKKRWIIVAAVAILGILLGRLAVRAFLNLLLGGTLLGGNFL